MDQPTRRSWRVSAEKASPGPQFFEASNGSASPAVSTPPTSSVSQKTCPSSSNVSTPPTRSKSALPVLDAMIGDGLITLERVDVGLQGPDGT